MPTTTTATVTGPGCEGRSAPTPMVALVLAQFLATRPDAASGTWYVREGDTIRFHVTRHESGVVTTTIPADRDGASRTVAL